MIIDHICNSARTEALGERFKQLFDFVRTHTLNDLPAGRVVIDGDALFINIDEPVLRSRENQKLEIHKRYIDVHFPLTSNETVGWTSVSQLTTSSDSPFDEERDFAFYSEPASVYLTVHPGEFYVMFPEDAHAPIIGNGTMRKAVAKIRID